MDKDTDDRLSVIIGEYEKLKRDQKPIGYDDVLKWQKQLNSNFDLLRLCQTIKNDALIGDIHPILERGLEGYIIGKEKEASNEIEESTTTDELTGLTNVKGYNSGIERCIKRANREGYKALGKYVALVFIDINRFKEEANDKYDHKFGDDVLKYVAGALKEYTRDTDLKARVGGDEFILVFDPFNMQNPNDFLMNLTAKINSYVQKKIGLEHPDKQAAVSVSLGMSFYEKDAENKEELKDHGDKAMYYAKTNPAKTEKGILNFHFFDPSINYVEKKDRKGRV
ncbi:MAG: GGDEF domain-containing protein [Candidatus Woesearchaeota archaeon]|nr:GGDEF domain-containing protein [Candidatus Woesearchaeota archaeon]